MARTPMELRPDPDRVGMKLVPSVAIFVFGFAMLQGWDRLLRRASVHWTDPRAVRIAEGIAAVLVVVGLAGCIFSAQFIDRVNPRLGDTSRSARAYVIILQLVGVTCLLIAVQLFRRALQ